MAPLTGAERQTFLDFLTHVVEGNRSYARRQRAAQATSKAALSVICRY